MASLGTALPAGVGPTAPLSRSREDPRSDCQPNTAPDTVARGERVCGGAILRPQGREPPGTRGTIPHRPRPPMTTILVSSLVYVLALKTYNIQYTMYNIQYSHVSSGVLCAPLPKLAREDP
eukprot:6764954-Pyramimonas_sp.AAC.1